MSTLLTDKASIDEFVHKTDGFHDAVVSEMVMKSNRHVSRDGWLYDDLAPFNMTLVVQSQFEESHIIILHISNVTEFRFDPRFDLEFEGEAEENGIVIYLSSKANATRSVIRAAEAAYEIKSQE